MLLAVQGGWVDNTGRAWGGFVAAKYRQHGYQDRDRESFVVPAGAAQGADPGPADHSARAVSQAYEGPRHTFEHDPAGRYHARRDGAKPMTQGDGRLHAASSRFLVGHGLARALHYLRTGRACSTFQSRRGLRHRLVGAYGVVGLSGVKDARKSVLIADA